MNEINLVSIVIPVYNAEKYIKRCLNSLINQSYKNIEIVIVDDGSKDKSLDIIKEFSKEDKRIKFISKENEGPSKARNCGLDNIVGDYIAFIDADDYIGKDYIKNLISKIEKSDLVVTNYSELKNNKIQKIELFKFLNKEIEQDIDERVIDEITLKFGGLVWGKLFRKSIIDKFNIKFNEKIKMSEDLLFVLEYVTNIKKINKIEEYDYFYNLENENSITHNYDKKLFLQQLEVTIKVGEILCKLKELNINVNKIISLRVKSSVMYAIYKETTSSRAYKEKLRNIESFINNKVVIENSVYFEKNGPIDNLIVRGIRKKRIIALYFLTIFRDKILNLYNKMR